MATEIFVIDDGSAPVVNGHRVPRGSGGHRPNVSRRLRRLGATVIDVPALSAQHLASAHLGLRPEPRPASTTRPDRRRSHLHVRSSRTVARGPEAAEAAAMLSRRERSEATVSYDLDIAVVTRRRPSPADLNSIESMIGSSDIVTLSEGDLASLRPGEYQADAVRWLMARGPAMIAVTDDRGGYVGYVRGGSVVHRRRATDVVATYGVGGALTAGLLRALDERDLLGAGAYESLRGIDLDEARDVFHDANRHH